MLSRFLIFSAFLFSILSFGQISNDLQMKIDSLVQIENPRKFNGIVLITQKEKPVYIKKHGFADLESEISLKADDKFIIMSNSKLFTSVLVLQQVEKGNIDLQAPIKEYLPELTQPWSDSVTVHQLLNHTHGIEELDKPLLFTPGTDFKYGNLCNKLLGKILYNVTGKTYRQLAEKLFKKLGLKNTFCYSGEQTINLVSSYYIKANEFIKIEAISVSEESIPAAGIVSNVYDLAMWNNKLHNGRILKKETYELLIAPSAMSQHNVFGKDKTGYGYNIRIAEQKGIKYIGHTGLGDGFASLNLYFPDNDLSLIILENVMGESSDNWYFYENAIKNLIIDDLVKN